MKSHASGSQKQAGCERGVLARSWCEVMSFVQLRVVASGITFQAEALMADLALSFSRSKSLSVTRGYC